MRTEAETQEAIKECLCAMSDRATVAQQEFMKALANREREPKNRETSVGELESLGETRQSAIRFFKDLANAGCGEFKAGRRGKQSRFVWDVKAKHVGREFLECWSSLRPTMTHNDRTLSFHAHTFLLRPGVQVTLELPLDLTTDESLRLANFIRALPFRHDTASDLPQEDLS